ncbi:hypothetical protein EO98_00315 [Methanosarcina sp. 2.H.T.1A.6]|uniref:hypothetical protein n=1 Tax=unclassified Methanosarcina TaxID=2644672 RepID=UPI000622373C|nr:MULTISPECIES: hypothetical protein [unclassified Methanosarcina]KKG14790.1 hypothetical protein EO94_02610 [Methanosarcina sp. 2.H.T.1A.3]KKG23763.1 hypothetical protein EO97_08175 [Methanosarcina sp. 2.H.T.1A.15]KKG23922.1 hypothetical protein EO98_00315 [Methanosarcina sp. 2.H.T.1A.6]KKG26440.1 hypothetical protein EO96_05785 [Methanosarcina sp. 2.H.T.1A.8]
MNASLNTGKRDDEVRIPIAIHLEGILSTPEGAGEIVVFVHGSETIRHSPRNKYVAKELKRSDSGTLLFDLLRPGKYNEYNLWLYK